MFTYIKVKNFKSLINLEIDFNKNNNTINKFIAIYGENGSGKTNIVEIFSFLQKTIISRLYDIAITSIPKDIFSSRDENIQMDKPKIDEMIYKNPLVFSDYRTVNQEDATEIKYGFKINNIEGYYYIKFKDKILEEKLYYLINKQRGFLFDINKENSNFILNKNVFLNERYNEELIENIKKYWGKYSFLSLMVFEQTEKNEEYMKENISEKFFDVMNMFFKTRIIVDDIDIINLQDFMLFKMSNINIRSGEIKKEKKDVLKRYESALNTFFSQSYSDIKNVTYSIKEKEEYIEYELFFEKLIGGKIRRISCNYESAGTRRILDRFEALVDALNGAIVVIDEIDNGTHDLLMKNIIESLLPEITGQLIITTHNTLLLEFLPKDNVYVITIDYNGNKKVNSINSYDFKVQKNNNIRDLYLKGVFGGIPYLDFIDFESIKNEMKEVKYE